MTLEDLAKVDGYNDPYWDSIPKELRDDYKNLFALFKLTLPTPAQLLYIYDKALRDNTYDFYKWQVAAHNDYLCKKYTAENPLELILLAVNGSGKDKMVLAPFLVWFLLTNIMGMTVVTSSSARQLDTQTEKYVRLICHTINNYHDGIEVFDIKQRRIRCNITGSEISLYATDDEGKAEGYHPVEPGRALAIVINEAKTVKDEIFEALTRCTGFTHWVEVSSPGKPDGHFYRKWHSDRSAVKKIHVVSDDCIHLGLTYKERLIEDYGENHYLYRSMVKGEFTDEEEQVVLGLDKFYRCAQHGPVFINDDGPTAGLDLSGGGDEQVLAIRNGNKLLKIIAWKIKDAAVLINVLIKAFKDNGLEGRPIYADAGGLGKPIIDLLHERGWKNVRGLLNQTSPADSLAYSNLGTEMWFTFANLVENQDIIVWHESLKDELFRKQLCNRYYKFQNKNNTTVAQLESKQQAKAKGHPSPDRADAVILCFFRYKTAEESKKIAKIRRKFQEETKETLRPTIQNFINSHNRYNKGRGNARTNGMIDASSRRVKIDKEAIRADLQHMMEHYFGKN